MIGTKGKLWNKSWGDTWFAIEVIGEGTEPNTWRIIYQEYIGKVKVSTPDEVNYEYDYMNKYFVPYTKLEKALM